MLDIETIRADFPILSTRLYGHRLVYLDSAATAQKPRAVIDATLEAYTALNANVHRGVHALSERMTERYEEARERVRAFIGARSASEVIFTSGATASLNLVSYSWCEEFVQAGDNIVVTEMEHHSNLVPWQQAALRRGAELRVLPFDEQGVLRMDLLAGLLDGRTRVVAVTQASNVLGTEPDLPAIVAAAHAAGAVVVVDGCQGAVHGGVDVQRLGCDFYAFSGHKLYGPTGIGVLYGREELLERMPPFLFGGDMVDRVWLQRATWAPLPLKFEAGTANFVGAVGLGEAIRYLERFDPGQVSAHEQELLRYATERLLALEGVRIFGTAPRKCPILSFDARGAHPYDIGMILDKLGIAIRTGMHCAEPVMRRYGVQGMCRASLALYNTREEVDALAEGVERALGMLRG